MANLWLLLKYLPQLIKIAVQLEEKIGEEILDFRVRRTKEKIDVIFTSNLKPEEIARRLNDVFKS